MPKPVAISKPGCQVENLVDKYPGCGRISGLEKLFAIISPLCSSAEACTTECLTGGIEKVG